MGLSWGGFFSTRYAAAHPQNVRKIYLDAPLLCFDGFRQDIGSWAARSPASGAWADDPEMPVNKAERLAAAKIPVLLLYGSEDQTVPAKLNCERFLPRFKAAGGQATFIRRALFGHHPHGLDPDKTRPIVDFFAR